MRGKFEGVGDASPRSGWLLGDLVESYRRQGRFSSLKVKNIGGPQPCWHAVGVSLLRGFEGFVPDGSGGHAGHKAEDYTYFLPTTSI